MEPQSVTRLWYLQSNRQQISEFGKGRLRWEDAGEPPWAWARARAHVSYACLCVSMHIVCMCIAYLLLGIAYLLSI